MRRIFKTVEDHLIECTTLEKGCWVHLQNPTKEEIDGLNTRFALDPTYLAAALDEEESARIEHDGDQTLIIPEVRPPRSSRTMGRPPQDSNERRVRSLES